MFNSETYCALLLLIELGNQYLLRGCTLDEISEKHYVPVPELKKVTTKLVAAGLVSIECEEKEWVFLRVPPATLFIRDVIEMFYTRFDGQFLDKKTGAFLPRSNESAFISKEHEIALRAVKSKFRKVSLEKYCQMNRFSGS